MACSILSTHFQTFSNHFLSSPVYVCYVHTAGHLTTADYALKSAARYQPDGLRQLPFDIAIRCCAFLDVHHVRMLSLTGVSCRLVTLVVQQIREQRRVQKSLVCFHTKVAPEEEPLGICCLVGRHPRSGRLDALTTSMNVLSYSAIRRRRTGCDGQVVHTLDASVRPLLHSSTARRGLLKGWCSGY